jgi:manganese/iron transport system permease protein
VSWPDLLAPFAYDYMVKAMWVSALIGALCAGLSAYLMLKGWSLMGDALAHAVVPGVALAYMLKLPFAAGAFFSGLLATLAMLAVKRLTRLKEDAVIGIIFTSFFAVGLVMISINPTAISVQTIVLGNILAISDEDALQVAVLATLGLAVLAAKWRDLMAVFFDEGHARSVGLPVDALRVTFFTLLAAATVTALQAVGACLVIAMVITPGATAYLLSDRFGRLLLTAVGLGAGSSFAGAYLSYFWDGATGGLIVTLQTALFLIAFLLAPKHGLIARRRRQTTATATATATNTATLAAERQP